MKSQYLSETPAPMVPELELNVSSALHPLRARLRSWYTRFAPLLAIAAIVVLTVVTNLGAWLTVGTVFLAMAILIRTNQEPRAIAIKAMTLIIAVSALDYSIWRLRVVNWSVWWVAVPLVAAEIFGILHTLGFQFTVWPRREPELHFDEDPTYRPIFIFIPTVNEGIEILSQTLRGAIRTRTRYLATYPHGKVTIVICNDGRVANMRGWEKVERLARRMKVVCVTRTVKGGAKAGNIENARQQVGATGDALIVIFDADQIAEPEFLVRTIEPFADTRVGWVQSGQYYRNLENPVSRWANDQQSLFYNVLCPGKSSQNAAFICGTNVMLRASALDEIGGLPQDSVTEDFAASIELHSRWTSIFLSGVMATGLGPMTLKSYLKQQERWAIGTLGVFRHRWSMIFLPGRSHLTLSQRVQYALACTHYLCGVRDLIYVLTPIVFILTGASAIKGADLGTFLWHFLPYWISSQVAFWYLSRGKTSVRGILIGFGSFYALLNSLFTVITGRRVGFAITSKTRDADSAWRALRPHMVLTALCIPALIVALFHQFDPQDQGKMLVSLLWVLYTLGLLGGMFWLGYSESLTEGRKVWLPDLSWLWSALRQIRQRPMLAIVPTAVAAAVLAFALVFPTIGRVNAEGAPKFSVQVGAEPRVFGLTLPEDVLKSDPPAVKTELGLQASIIGRVQNIDDTFDTSWATQLAVQGQRPWITLIFHANGDPAYMSSLPAIANGVYDNDLQRWALRIREFGKPVYLTILPHVDRNWALSSAVTNGGIPQDVPRAWLHVQDVFHALHVDNVAWVWAPADPAHDQIYAPPPSSIDVVILSMISYPQTTWADPQQAIQAVVARYPSLPLFVEISAQGSPAQKATWLKQVGTVIPSQKNVVALLYHDGSPDTNAVAQQHQAWSMASDPTSLQGAQSMVKTAGLQAFEVQK